MANRREFLQSGLAVAVAAAAAPTLSAWADAPVTTLYKVVFDEGWPASRLFGAEARRLGARAHGVRGDITDLWYYDLYHRWRQSTVPVAGMTRHGSLFCLEMMARDAGLRVIYRAHHRPGPKGVRTHEVFGPPAARRRQADLGGAEAEWCRTAAEIVMAWPAGPASIARAHSNIADADQTMMGPDTLISWIIAPISRNRRSV